MNQYSTSDSNCPPIAYSIQSADKVFTQPLCEKPSDISIECRTIMFDTTNQPGTYTINYEVKAIGGSIYKESLFAKIINP